MKVAVIYNRESQRVINLFGIPNREKYGLKNIKRITDSLKAGGHQVMAFEGDKDLIDRLEEFMPKVLKWERPGMAFNLSYGIQGQARYTHVPGILEMVGIPYVGSGPLAHSLALDKVVAKMIFRQQGIPTPEFAVLDSPEADLPDLPYPLIVKPKNEAVSFGLKVVHDQDALREAAGVILETFEQPVLVEQYVEGREINVGLIGNNPPEALPPVELSFGEGGPNIYTYEDKSGKSGREIVPVCPAPISPELSQRAQDLARKAFAALGCYDCARVDMRMDADGNLYILEINSLPSLGQRGSYVKAAEAVGLDFAGLVNRLVEVAAARYFGTPSPPTLSSKETDPGKLAFAFLTERRDRMERRVRELTRVSSRTGDPVGIRAIANHVHERLTDLGLQPAESVGDGRTAWLHETPPGLDGGTLLIVQLDVPLGHDAAGQIFRRDPEMLFGEGVAVSRAPIVVVEYVLRALRHLRRRKKIRLGVLSYADEGSDAEASAPAIRAAAARAGKVLVLRPGAPPDYIVNQRRGQRILRLVLEGRPHRLGQVHRRPEVFRWFCAKVEELCALTSKDDRVAVSVLDAGTTAFPLLLPHRVSSRIIVSYLEPKQADAVEVRMRELLGSRGPRWSLETLSDRPPMVKRKAASGLFEGLGAVAAKWELPLRMQSSLWPSVAGLVPADVPVLCGVGPVGEDLHKPQESVQRISLVQRTLLLTEFLVNESEKSP